MKIKSRKQRLKLYQESYPKIYLDVEERLLHYFNDRGWDLNSALKKANKRAQEIQSMREYKEILIVMYEFPMKTERPRHTYSGRTYSPNAKENNRYMGDQLGKILKKSHKLINTPAEITIDAYLEMPSGLKPYEVLLYEAKVLSVEDTPDYDNIAKCYTDMLTNNLITDDDIFWSGTARKFYSTLPRVEIRIRYQSAHDSDYVYNRLRKRKSVKELIQSGLLELKHM